MYLSKNEQFSWYFETFKEIVEKYGISLTCSLDEIESSSDFSNAIGFIGLFNSGKSSLINALIEKKLLPTGILPTDVPTVEISCGENFITVHRGKVKQNTDLIALRDKTIDLSDVSLVEMKYSHPFLEKIPDIKLIDFPGLSSNIQSQADIVMKNLNSCMAYLIIFSVEEPVVKDEISAILSHISAQNKSIIAVLTKCDKVTPEMANSAKNYLTKSLSEFMNCKQEEIEIITTATKNPFEIDSLKRILLSCQDEVWQNIANYFKESLLDVAKQIQQYLSYRIVSQSISVSELDLQIKVRQEQIKNFEEMYKNTDEEMKKNIEKTLVEINENVVNDLELFSDSILTMFVTNQDLTVYITNIISGIIFKQLVENVEPLVLNYIKKTISLIKIYELEENSVAEIYEKYKDINLKNEISTYFFENSIEFQKNVSFIIPYYNKKDNLDAVETVKNKLIPDIKNLAIDYIENKILPYIYEYQTKIYSFIVARLNITKDNLQNICATKQNEDESQQKQNETLSDDLDLIQEIIAQISK